MLSVDIVVVNGDCDSPQPTYELSGIVYNGPMFRWTVPLQRHKILDGKCLIYPARLGDMGDRPNGPYGFPLHSYCWQIVQRLMGPLVDNQLGIFIQMLEDRWDGKRIDNIESFMTVSPMRVPALGTLIKYSELRGKESLMINSKNQTANANTDKSLSFIECSALSLPLEIKFMILDHAYHKDIESMLLATQWKIPDTYWRMRLHSGNMFELQGLEQEMNIDWQFLCVQFEIKSQTWPTLRNRNRIVNIVKDIIGPFHDVLGVHSREELKQLNQDREKRLTEMAMQAKKRKRRKKRRPRYRVIGLGT